MMARSFEPPEESSSASPSARLRHLMQQGMVVAPFVCDGLQAKMAPKAGLQAVYMTGFDLLTLKRLGCCSAGEALPMTDS